MNIKKIFFATFFFMAIFNTVTHTSDKADMVVYSFDRPIQLYAFLESAERYILNLGEVHVIYRTSSQEFESAYKETANRFTFAHFHQQGKNPHTDFKLLTMRHAFTTPHDYIIFAVDDILVKDFIDISYCIRILKKTDAYGFYLRLGLNITECYMLNDLHTPAPPHTYVETDTCIYQFKTGTGDWAYPNTVDMTIYKKSDIKTDLEDMHFVNTAYEGFWSQRADLNKYGLFFTESKIVNLPLNLIREGSQDNRNAQLFSSTALLDAFNKGLKFDINNVKNINNKSPHMHYVPSFIKR